MNKRKRVRIPAFLLSVMVLVGILFPNNFVARADTNLERTSVSVTEFKIEHRDGSTGSTFSIFKDFNLSMAWDASMYHGDLHAGDYFNVTLPNNMVFPTNTSATNFDILSPDGSAVVARAVVTPNPTGGGTVKVTFSDYVENRQNIKGTMYLTATFGSNVTPGTNNTFSVVVNGTTTSINVPIEQVNVMHELLGKWGERITSTDYEVKWKLRINQKNGSYQNAIISDMLSTDDGNLQGMHYIEGSFRLQEVVIDQFGNVTSKIGSPIDINNQIQFNADKTSFTYNLGSVNNKQYMMEYRSTYVPGVKLKNSANFDSNSEDEGFSTNYQSATSGGTGAGDLLSKIKLIKLAGDTRLQLPGAVFLVTSVATGSSFQLTTGANGEVVSGLLPPGDYTVTELNAPFGYLPDTTVYTLTVRADQATIQTITDERETVSIPVTKHWVGTPGTSATIKLLADGVEVDSSTLTAAGRWQHTFENLPKYNQTDGHEIIYTLKEVKVSGYQTSISGDAQHGFSVTNTENPKNPNLPKTGDNNSVALWLTLMLVSISILIIGAYFRNKKHSNEE